MNETRTTGHALTSARQIGASLTLSIENLLTETILHALREATTDDLIREIVRRDAWPPRPSTRVTYGPLSYDPASRIVTWHEKRFVLQPRLARTFTCLLTVYPDGLHVRDLSRMRYPERDWKSGHESVRVDVTDLRFLLPGLIPHGDGRSHSIAYYRLVPDAPLLARRGGDVRAYRHIACVDGLYRIQSDRNGASAYAPREKIDEE